MYMPHVHAIGISTKAIKHTGSTHTCVHKSHAQLDTYRIHNIIMHYKYIVHVHVLCKLSLRCVTLEAGVAKLADR